jgi:hypothetical protein
MPVKRDMRTTRVSVFMGSLALIGGSTTQARCQLRNCGMSRQNKPLRPHLSLVGTPSSEMTNCARHRKANEPSRFSSLRQNFDIAHKIAHHTAHHACGVATESFVRRRFVPAGSAAVRIAACAIRVRPLVASFGVATIPAPNSSGAGMVFLPNRGFVDHRLRRSEQACLA